MKTRKTLKRLARNFFQLVVLVGFIVLAMFAGVFTFDSPLRIVSAQATTQVYVDPPTTTGLLPGDVFAVSIMITGVDDLKSWQFHMSFRGLMQGVLSVTEVIEGDFLMIGGSTYFTYNMDNPSGLVQAGAIIVGPVPGVSGDGWLATIIFEVVGGGESPLDLHDTILLNSNSTEIMHDVTDGYYTGMVPHAAFTYSPFAPTAGETVTFNASGSYDPDGLIAEYSWNFGDNTGSSDSAPSATHVYTYPDTYLVSLTVVDNDGFNETTTALLTVTQPPPPSTPEIFVDPPRIEDPTILPGHTISIYIRITQVIDLYAWEFRLGWRASLLNFLNASEGNFLTGSEEAPTYFVYTLYEDQNGTDYIVVGCTRLGAILGTSGSGILASITLGVEGIDETILDLYDTRLRDSDVDPISHTQADGYFSNTGSPPPVPSEYTRMYLPNQWITDGSAMNWHTDDGSWPYTLPFDFPFFGTYYRTIYISSNGLITFNGPDSAYWNSIPELSFRYAIAVAWDDWLTYDPQDIFIWQPDSNSMAIRWYVRHIGSSAIANFEAILNRNGVIQFNYGYNDGPVTATIGISNGAGEILAEDATNLNLINTILFTPYRPEHDLQVQLEAPARIAPRQTCTVNATVLNAGSSNETNVDLQLFINGNLVDSVSISQLLSGSAHLLSYTWSPQLTGSYNVTAYVLPVPNENVTVNNRVSQFVEVVSEVSIFVTEDNYPTPPDGDLDYYIFNNDPRHPIEWAHWYNVPSPVLEATLQIYAFDVDWPTQVDEVYFNGFYLGPLQGANDQWSLTTFPVPAEYVQLGLNVVTVYVDMTNTGWGMAVDWANLIVEFVTAEHELAVSLNAPAIMPTGRSVLLNATVTNLGLNNETNVELQLLIDGSLVSSVVIPELSTGSSYTLSYLWTAATEGTYNATAYVIPVPGEDNIANNERTAAMSVVRPLIQPIEGQWANYTITTPYSTMLLNTTYSCYISPIHMSVLLWMGVPFENISTRAWLTLNIVTRRVEAGMWNGYWYPLWIQTDVAVGSTVGILDSSGTVTESRYIEVGDYLVECWGLQVQYYSVLYTFWFDKVNGLVVAIDGVTSSLTETWRLTSTNVPLVYLPRLRVEIAPESGAVGTTLTVVGVNAMPRSTLEIYWDNTCIGTAVADENGNFAYTFAVPPCARELHSVTVIDLATGVSDIKAFTVISTISVTPASGIMGTKVQVTGLGFGANEHVVLTFEDMQIAEINADSSGSFTATFNIPLALKGQYQVKAWGGNYCALAAFTVTEVGQLDVNIDVGAIYFKGETAEFYVQTAFCGKPVDVTTMDVKLYVPDGTAATLAYSRIATGLYMIRYTISGKGSMTGTYTVVVEVAQESGALDAYGTSLRTFVVKPTWERDAPKMAALSITSIGLIGSMLVLWKREKKRNL